METLNISGDFITWRCEVVTIKEAIHFSDTIPKVIAYKTLSTRCGSDSEL